ncbi:MAG TPA: hypothetical protein VEQ34_01690, partial [Pyrinomonadaceae bacterium]|nr:hypothetical protein [Pyrinomonadaceae bacterium]
MSLCLFAAVFFAVQTATATPPLSDKGWQDRLETARQRGLEFLQARRSSNLAASPFEEFKTRRIFADEEGLAHLHVQQALNGVPVFGAEAIVHFNDNNEVAAMTDDLKSAFRVVNTIPSYDEKLAAAFATDIYGCAKCLTAAPEVDLWILPGGKTDRLAYRVQLRREDGSEETSMPVYFIDAHSGKKLWSYDNLQTATGISLYSGSVTINTYYSSSGATYYMEDISRKIGTFDSRNTTSSTYRFSDPNNYWDTTSQKAAVDAHYGAAKVYDYFYNTHGRRGIDGNGGPGYYTSA